LIERFVRAFVVEDRAESVEAPLLSREASGRWSSGFGLESAVHAFVRAVLLRGGRLDELGVNTELDPPDREPRETGQTDAGERCAVVSTFFGIIIRMFYREHGVAHFHADYQGQQATFTLDGELLAGEIGSRTARRLIKEWSTAHQIELQANWDRLTQGEALERIAPLE
jgi:hypothetical protein